MARVPLSIVPDTSPPATPPSDYQHIDSSPANFGGLIGQSEQKFGADAEQAGDKLTQTADLIQTRYNDHAVTDAINGLQSRAEALTTGNPSDPTAPPGLYTLQGAAAMKAGPQVAQQLNSLRDEISGGLQNDAQRLLFQQQSVRYLQYKRAEISNHVIRETNRYGTDANTGAILNAGLIASNNPNSDDVIGHSIQDAVVNADKNTLINSGPPPDPAIASQEDIDRYKNVALVGQVKARTHVIQSAVDGILTSDPTNGAIRAKQILDKFGGMMDPGVRESLTQRTKGAADQAGVASAINNVMRGPVRPPDPAVVGQIQKSAVEEGVPPDQALTIAHIESGIGTAPDRPGSQHTGVFQLGAAEKASVNLAANAPPVEQAAKGVQWLKGAYDLASQTVGHPAEGWQTYMVHQQGAGAGPALLRANPNDSAVAVLTAAGSQAPTASIVQNGGSADMTVGQFLGVWQNTYARRASEIGVMPGTAPAPTHNPAAFGMEQQRMEQARAEAPRAFPNNPVRQKEIIDGVWQEVQQNNILQSKLEAEQAKARLEAQDGVMNAAITTLSADPTKFDVNTLAAKDSAGNYLLTPQQRISIIDYSKKAFQEHGVDDLAPYGPGYAKAYNDIVAPAGSPNKINGLSDILQRGAPGGDLSKFGVERLAQVFAASRKDPDAYAISKAESGMLNFAKSHLSFEEDTGPVKIRDPKGEDIFNSQFVPQFEKGLSDAKASGKPEDVWKYLQRDNVEKMFQGMRSSTQMAKDRLTATGQTDPSDVEKPGTPIPPVPTLPKQGDQPGQVINPTEWQNIMTGPLPVAQDGSAYTHKAWAQALTLLMQNPNEQTIKNFDDWFGARGYDGAEIVRRLKAKSAAQQGNSQAGVTVERDD